MSLEHRTVTQYRDGKARGQEVERAACLEIVQGAGCLCLDESGRPRSGFDALTKFRDEEVCSPETGNVEYRSWWEVQIHDSRCPVALAARIAARGEARP